MKTYTGGKPNYIDEVGLSFIVITHKGIKEIRWFKDIDALIASMLKNPHDTYRRNQ